MNKNFLFMISLFLVTILISTSFVPQATRAQDLEPIIESPKMESSFRLQGNNAKRADMTVVNSFAGITLKAGDESLTWSNMYDGCLASYYDGPEIKSFVAPLTFPSNAVGSNISVTYKNLDVIPNISDYVIMLLASPNLGGPSKLIGSVRLTQSAKGFHTEGWPLSHEFDLPTYSYWIEARLPQGVAKAAICSVNVFTQVDLPVYYIAFPAVRTK